MIIFKISPSGHVNWKTCQRQYYIGYNLGIRGDSGKAANLGTTTHKVLELLALAKLHHQKTGEDKFVLKDDKIGQYEFNTANWNDIKEIKLGRTLFDIADHEQVDDIYSLVYTYYANKHADQNWDEKDAYNVKRWIYTALSEQKCLYDPRQREVIQPEQYLSYTIPEDWARYDFGDGITGNLTLTGIIDLIVKSKDGSCHQVIDWKSGRRVDFATQKPKTAENLHLDTQLMYYYYFISKLYPEFGHTLFTIFYLKDGGPFSPIFEPSDLPRIEDHIKKTFEEIKNCEFPEMIDERQVHRVCQWCSYRENNLCKDVGEAIKLYGLEATTEKFRKK